MSSLAKRETASAKYFNHLLTDSYTPIGIFHNRKPREIKVLDFGMGWGHWAIAGVANGLNVVGAELSETRIQFAKSKGIKILNSLEDKKVKFDFHIQNQNELLDIIEKNDVVYIFPHQIEFFPKKFFDISIAIDCLHEMEKKIVEKYGD